MKKILLVEDESVLQDAYRLVLSVSGYEVSVASNGLEGLASLRKSTPDLILLDLLMPTMNGREFLRNFSKSTYPNTKIIMYTNLSDAKTEAEMLQLGADKFILKSALSPKALVELIKATFANK